MKRREGKEEELLNRALGLFRPTPEQLERTRENSLRRFDERAGKPLVDDATQLQPVRLNRRWWPALAAVAATAVVIASVWTALINRPPAFLETAEGRQNIQNNEPVVANGPAGEILTLADGTRVEMRAQTALSLEQANDGTLIRLLRGSVIVNAAKQRNGHLYVQTPDVMVTVQGTVFLVESAAAGSRVAVIEGEVHVQQNGTLKKLLSGDQVATPPPLKPILPLSEELSWSRNAPQHVALLQQTPAGAAASVRQEFSVSSVKPTDPATPIGPSAGFACRGVDGVARAPFGTERVAFVAPLGRCVGERVTIPALVEFAYGMPHRYGTNAPDWAGAGAVKNVEMAPGRTVPMLTRSTFQIEATVDDSSTATMEQMRLMVQSLLGTRFKMKFHREIQEVPGFVLQIAGNGLKLKETIGEETPLSVDYSVLGSPVLRGKASISEFRRFIIGFTNPTGFVNFDLSSYVVDKTGLTGIYDFSLVMPVPGGTAGRGGNSPPVYGLDDPRSEAERFRWRAPALAEALEDQLGIRMQPQKVPVEVLVIDYLEQPSPN